jgi:hypothetical protein
MKLIKVSTLLNVRTQLLLTPSLTKSRKQKGLKVENKSQTAHYVTSCESQL